MVNSLAISVLVLYPVFALVCFYFMRPLYAVFLVLAGAYLFLPQGAGIDPPGIPPLVKETAPLYSIFLAYCLVPKARFRLLPPKGVMLWLFMIALLLPFFTVLTNGEVVWHGDVSVNPLAANDIFSMILRRYLELMPFLLGLFFVKDIKDQKTILVLLVGIGLLYSFLMLWEIRMSPQLHRIVYGFFPHDFGQQMRFGGFRSVVFLGHGLLTTMFLAICLMAATILVKCKENLGPIPMGPVLLFLLVVLILNKTVSGAALFLFFAALLLLFRPRNIARFAIFFGFLVLFYPIFQLFGLLPFDPVVEVLATYLPERAESLVFRLDHERDLLARAMEKPFFGWGGWGRNRLEESVTDGFLIITLGTAGILGFFAIFGLAFTAIYKGAKNVQALSGTDQYIQAGGVLLSSLILLDQIPNASLSNLYWFLIGGFAGLDIRNNEDDSKDGKEDHGFQEMAGGREL